MQLLPKKSRWSQKKAKAMIGCISCSISSGDGQILTALYEALERSYLE